MTTHDVSQLLSGEDLKRPIGRRKLALSMALGLALVIAVAILLGGLALQDRADRLRAELEERITILAETRAELIGAWLDGTARIAAPLVQSDFLRLFATEIDITAETDPLAARLSAQGPYMIEVLEELVRQNGLLAAYLVNRNGRAVLSNSAASELSSTQETWVAARFSDADTWFSPLRMRDQELVVDVALPIRALDAAEPGDEPRPVAALVITLPVTGVLADFVADRPLSYPGEHTILLQSAGGGHAGIVTADAGGLGRANLDVDAGPPLAFGERPSLAGSHLVFSAGVEVPGAPWFVIQERDRSLALEPLARARTTWIGIIVLTTTVIAAAFIAVWFNQSNRFNLALAEQFRDLATRIDSQRRLLYGINGTIREWIGLKRPDGTYVYVNPAFAEAVGRPVEQIVGQTDEAVFGHGQGMRLEQSDRAARDAGRAITAEEQIYVQGHRRYLEMSKVPLILDDGEDHSDLGGIVTVGRDVTELVEERAKHEATLRHTIAALVQTIELSDPYLAGHSRLVQQVAARIAVALNLPSEERATLDVAANLSQIGKLFVPREILTKPGRLTPSEIEVMQTHVAHAARILEGIDFGLPVRETVYAMYERLDGSGYPQGLSGDDVSMRSRILGLSDVFAARIRPRSYRAALSPQEAADVIKKYSAAKYGEDVIEALVQMVANADSDASLFDSKPADRTR